MHEGYTEKTESEPGIDKEGQEAGLFRRLEGKAHEKLAELLRIATVGTYEGSGRLFVKAEVNSPQEFEQAKMLMSLAGVYPWAHEDDLSFTIDNHFDIELLVEEKIIPDEALSDTERALLSTMDEVTTPLSSDDLIEKNEVTDSTHSTNAYAYAQYRKKYRRLPGGVVFKKLSDGSETEITREEQSKMLFEAQHGDEHARNEFLTMNMGLASFCALGWHRNFPSIDFDEMLQVALITMNKCIDGYAIEEERSQFQTYAIASINFQLIRHVKENIGLVHIPSYKLSQFSKMEKFEHQGTEPLDREGMIAEVSSLLQVSTEEAEMLIGEKEIFWKPEYVDIDAMTDSEELETLSTGNAPEEAFEKTELKELTARGIDALPPRQAMMLRMRFGIDTDRPVTHAEIGKAFGVSREAVRLQLAHIIENKLKMPLRTEHLEDYNIEK